MAWRFVDGATRQGLIVSLADGSLLLAPSCSRGSLRRWSSEVVSQLCRAIDQSNGRGAWNVRATMGGHVGYIATCADKPMVGIGTQPI